MDKESQQATNLAGFFHTGAEKARVLIQKSNRTPDQYTEAQRALQLANEGRRFIIEPMDRIICSKPGVHIKPYLLGSMAYYGCGDLSKGYPADSNTIAFSEWGSQKEQVIYQGRALPHLWWPVDDGIIVREVVGIVGKSSFTESFVFHGLSGKIQTLIINPARLHFVSQVKRHQGVCVYNLQKIRLHLTKPVISSLSPIIEIPLDEERTVKNWFFISNGIFVYNDDYGWFKHDTHREKDRTIFEWSQFSGSGKIESIEQHPHGALVVRQLSADSSSKSAGIKRQFTLWISEAEEGVSDIKTLYEGECVAWKAHDLGLVIKTNNNSYFLHYMNGKSELLYKGPTYCAEACSYGLLVTPESDEHLVILCPTASHLRLIKNREFAEQHIGMDKTCP